MKTALRVRFWFVTASALLGGCLFFVTSLWPDWIGALASVEPDNHSGSLEWGIVATLLIVSVVTSLFALIEWRRQRLAVPTST